MGLLKAIPMSWKNMVKERPRSKFTAEDKHEWFINIDGRRISIKSIRSKDIYSKSIAKRSPTAEAKWRAEGYELMNLSDIYEQPYKCCKSTKLQSLHYRTINRYIPTREFLNTRGIFGSPLCEKYFEVDSLHHFFFFAKQNRICISLLRQLQTIFRHPSDFVKVDTVFFGCQEAPEVVNLIILLYKQYIVTCKIGENSAEPRMEALISTIRSFFDSEKVSFTRNQDLGRFWSKWGNTFNENNQIRLQASE